MLILTIMVLFSDSTKTDFHDSQLKKILIYYILGIVWPFSSSTVWHKLIFFIL